MFNLSVAHFNKVRLAHRAVELMNDECKYNINIKYITKQHNAQEKKAFQTEQNMH